MGGHSYLKKTFLITFFFAILISCKKEEYTAVATDNHYVGNISCVSCHKTEHDQWSTSHHFMAMQPANDLTVLGDFNNVIFVADGVTSRFFKKNNKFYINTEGEDGKYQDFEIKFTFGFKPLQQYLVVFPGGRMQPTRASWDTEKKKWFNQYSGDKIPAGDWLHWTGNGQNWNTMCASCHSTNLKKGYDVKTDTYKTTYNDINVSCESCHGPGKIHIDYIKSSEYKDHKKTVGSFLKGYKGEGQMAQINNCGNCHARRVDITGSVLPTKVFMDDFIEELPTNTFFYADGQMKEEDYNYTSFLQSKMFHKGVQCTNCHNPHSGKLKKEGSLVCSQCHAITKYNTPKHTMHLIQSKEVNCIACHMPSKLYMGIDLRHDHSFRIPRPDLSAKYGTPNTCNSCHKDKSADWAAQAIAKNFGKNRKYHFSDDLIPASKLNTESQGHFNNLLKNTTTPNIVKAAVMEYISQLNGDKTLEILLNHLNDNAPSVRFRTLKGLNDFDPSFWIEKASPLLKDNVRGVRIAAAELFLTIPEEQIASNYRTALESAKKEYEKFIIYQTDFAQGNVQAGDYYSRLGNLQMAEKFYKRAVKKDNRLTIAHINLASTLNALEKNDEALQHLLVAQKLEPKSDHVYYTLGLLYAEMKNNDLAIKSLQKAIALNSSNIQAYYNYGLILQQNNNSVAAEKVFRQALKVDPTNGNVLYALTILYAQQNNISKAVEVGMVLKQYHGNNPDYQPLLQNLKLL